MIPTHGAWCQTITFAIQCRGCQANIFLFKCNCGSLVLFDELGPPWPVHDCDNAQWAKNLPKTVLGNGSISVPWKNGITFIRPALDFAVEPAIVERARRRARKEQRDPIRKIEAPASGSKQVIGVLREITSEADPLKAFGLPGTDMTWALLGERWREPIGKITVHSEVSAADHLESYTAWVPTRLISDKQTVRGAAVALSLKSVAIPNNDAVWFCEEFDSLT